MTEDLEARLRSAVKDAATTLVPSAGVPVLQPLLPQRTFRRSQAWAGAGVLVAAAVAVGLVVTSAGDPSPRSLPSSAAAVSLGPPVTELPYLPQPLMRWTSGVSFSSSTNGWALGTRCPTAKASKCPMVLAHTTDAGRTWSLAPASSVLAQAVAVLAGPKGIWAITGNSNTLWFSSNGAETWTKLQTAAIASYRVVNGRFVAYVHGGPDLKVSPCTVTVSRVVFDGATRVSSQRLSDDVLGGFTSSQVGMDGSIWRSRPNTYSCSHGMGANGTIKMQVAPPGQDFGPLHTVPSSSTGAWSIAAVSGSTAEAFLGKTLTETTDGGITWKTVGTVQLGQFAPESVALAGNHLLVESGLFLTDLRVQVRDAAGQLTSPLTIGAPPPPPSTTKSFSYDEPTVDAVVNPTANEIGLLFRGRFVLSTDAGKTWHLQGTLPS